MKIDEELIRKRKEFVRDVTRVLNEGIRVKKHFKEIVKKLYVEYGVNDKESSNVCNAQVL